jgi:hypothetical protein
MALSPVEEQLLDAATMFGWRSAHFRPLLTKKGWRTPVSGDGKGWPDFCLVRADRMLFVECKGEGARLQPEQQAWRDAIERVPGVEYHLVRPADVESFVKDVLASR